MKVAVILDTRPKNIKLRHVIREISAQSVPYTRLNTRQHYHHILDNMFFVQQRLPDWCRMERR